MPFHIGPHPDEVAAVDAFVRSGPLFQPGRVPPDGFDVHVIHSLDGVRQYREPPPGLGEDDDSPLVWLDILKLEEPAYYSGRGDVLGARRPEFEGQVDRLWVELCRVIDARLAGRMPRYEVEEVMGHFNLILRHSALFGPQRRHDRPAVPGLPDRRLPLRLAGPVPRREAGRVLRARTPVKRRQHYGCSELDCDGASRATSRFCSPDPSAAVYSRPIRFQTREAIGPQTR